MRRFSVFNADAGDADRENAGGRGEWACVRADVCAVRPAGLSARAGAHDVNRGNAGVHGHRARGDDGVRDFP